MIVDQFLFGGWVEESLSQSHPLLLEAAAWVMNALSVFVLWVGYKTRCGIGRAVAGMWHTVFPERSPICKRVLDLIGGDQNPHWFPANGELFVGGMKVVASNVDLDEQEVKAIRSIYVVDGSEGGFQAFSLDLWPDIPISERWSVLCAVKGALDLYYEHERAARESLVLESLGRSKQQQQKKNGGAGA